MTSVTGARDSANANSVYAMAEGNTPMYTEAASACAPASAASAGRPGRKASMGTVPAQVANAATSIGR